MCGIAGVIGRSKHPSVSFTLMTRLFAESDVRGTDAAGFWATEEGDDGSVLYHKEPLRSSNFIHRDTWKSIKKYNPNLCIMHARATSQGVGDASCNRNNHPHVSRDHCTAVVHNGRIYECTSLRKRYEIRSECDSEILLRIFEHGSKTKEKIDPDLKEFPEKIAKGMMGIRDIFGHVTNGHMAVAVGERGENGRRDLWLFRNEHRPLFVIDVRETLGQVFFCSESVIWKRAVMDVHNGRNLLQNRKNRIYELPKEQIWHFTVDNENPVVDEKKGGYNRHRIVYKHTYTDWDENGPRIVIPEPKLKIKLVTPLNEREELVRDCRIQTPSNVLRTNPDSSYYNGSREVVPVSATPRESFPGNRYPSTVWDGDHGTYSDQVPDIDNDDNEGSGEDYLDRDVLDDSDHEGLVSLELEESVHHPVIEHIDRTAREYSQSSRSKTVGYDEKEYDQESLVSVINKIKEVANSIETQACNLVGDQSITHYNFDKCRESLEMLYNDMKNILEDLEAY